MLALSLPALFVLPSLCPAAPPAVQDHDLPDPDRAEVVAYLADRSSRDLTRLLADWRAASGAAQTALEADVAELAAKRRGYLAEAMARAPEAAFGSLLSPADRADVDALAPGNTAQPVTLTGTLGATWASTSDGLGEVGPLPVLTEAGGGTHALRVAGGSVGAGYGSELSVEGYALAEELLTESAGVTLLASGPASLAGELKWLCVFIDLNGQGKNNSKATVQGVLETNGSGNSVEYYEQNSSGLVTMSYDYVDPETPIQIDVDEEDYCDHNLIREEVVKVLEPYPFFQSLLLDPDFYGISIFFDWSNPPGAPCPFFNRATHGKQKFRVGTNDYDLATMWLTSSPLSLHTTLHELGHAVGCAHSSRWDCESLQSPGTGEEGCFCDYGDPISCMGGANAGSGPHCQAETSGVAHLNGFHKHETVGWIDPALVQETFVAGSNDVYYLYPIGYEALGASSAGNRRQLLKIDRGDLEALYVDFRRKIPGSNYEKASAYTDVMSTALNMHQKGAAMLYVQAASQRPAIVNPFLPGANHVYGSCLTWLPEAGPSFTSSFTDPCTNVTVTALGLTETNPPLLAVRVDAPTVCEDTDAPAVVMTSPVHQSQVSGQIQLTAEITDANGISEVEFVRFVNSPEAGLVSVGVIPLSVTGPVADYPVSMSFQTSGLANGTHGFGAIARDNPANCCPNRGESKYTVVQVLNNVPGPPYVILIGPLPGASSGLPVTLDSDSTAPSGVASVEYYLDPAYADVCGAGEAFDGPHPASCPYHAFFPAFSKHFPDLDGGRGAFLIGMGDGDDQDHAAPSLPPGDYTWWCRTYANSGEATLSETRTLTVTGQGPFDVDVPIDEGASVPDGATVTIPADVTADDGEPGYVDFFVDGAFLARDETAPYEADWTVPGGTASHVLRADAFGIGGRTATDEVTVQVP